MKLYYYRDAAGNFGDDLNAWLWPRLIPDLLAPDDGALLVGIGTLLNSQVPAADSTWVFGSGAGYGAKPAIDSSWKFFCVRGPLTASALGLSPGIAVTDAAALVNGLVPVHEKQRRVSFMPHHVSKIRAELAGLNLPSICEEAGVHYIDPSADPAAILADIQSSELILGEAMHACIVADSLRIPWIAVRLFDHLLPFKWSDWCRSLDLEYQPFVYAGDLTGEAGGLQAFFSKLRSAARPSLSYSAVLNSRLNRLQDLLGELRKEHRARVPAPQAATVAIEPPPTDSSAWLRSYYSGVQELAGVVPHGSPVILLDDDQWAAGSSVAGRRRMTFMEREGVYCGPPADGTSAVAEVMRLQKAGAKYLVFAWPAFWWLDHYEGLRDYLSERREILSTARVRVFELTS